ncbi:MAG TPA: GNAT family N-acetyltransferase [Burkholderiales bacterium]|nr:GNAT family N-acetyltransferase [Burkholderiales bacterium]
MARRKAAKRAARKPAGAKPRRAAAPAVRRLVPGDLDAVVRTDAALSGRTRRAYFERRLATALRDPDVHLQYAAVRGGAFAGHAFARVQAGEFGRAARALRVEVISVARAAQGRGVGRALHRALESAARKRGIGELRTVAGWRDHGMLRFLDAMGYDLAASHVLERAAGGGAAPAAGVQLRALSARDLDDVVRIDREVTGRDRHAYMQQALDEALRESGARISLAALVDGALAGFLMARADLGDFGRTEPVAVLDTIGVAPGLGRRGVGRALLGQLLANLTTLRIERVETVVDAGAQDLLGFFERAGFVPAQRLAFVRLLA